MNFQMVLIVLLTGFLLSLSAWAEMPLIPRTGQTSSYAVGDDGALQKGVAWPTPRFTDNSNGTLTDNLTGLIWPTAASCFGLQTWSAALTDATSLASGSCSLSDGSNAGTWRLPNRKELKSLIDLQQKDNAAWLTSVGFTKPPSDYPYWSSSTVANNNTYAWRVNLLNGYVSSDSKLNKGYVIPVRGGN